MDMLISHETHLGDDGTPPGAVEAQAGAPKSELRKSGEAAKSAAPAAPRPGSLPKQSTKPVSDGGAPGVLKAPRKTVKKTPPLVEVPPPESFRPPEAGRPLSPDELQMERERIYARLTSIPNVVSRPSPSDYVIFEVPDRTAVQKKLVAHGVPAEIVRFDPKIPNALRVFVRVAKKNEEFLRALEQAAR